MNTWAPLWIGLVDSSIWEEPDHVFRVFIAMMSLKDSCHMVSLDPYKLSRRIHMPMEQVLDALKVLSSPDTRRPGQEEDGRRIRAVEGGWEIINGEKYLLMVKEEMKLARHRRASANYRAKKAGRPLPFPKDWDALPRNGKPLAGEVGHIALAEAGATEKQLEQHDMNSLPPNVRAKVINNPHTTTNSP